MVRGTPEDGGAPGCCFRRYAALQVGRGWRVGAVRGFPRSLPTLQGFVAALCGVVTVLPHGLLHPAVCYRWQPPVATVSRSVVYNVYFVGTPPGPPHLQLFVAAGGLKQLCSMVADSVASEPSALSHVAIQCLLQVGGRTTFALPAATIPRQGLLQVGGRMTRALPAAY